uniref:Peptidase M56, BlaR1 n=1 Tax=Solibacter usitatus (strain Ellin6076) TaxID=234267 RepID=Q01V15_SOLUE
MNAIRMLSSEPWVESLGWTLVHFLWQGLLIAAVYAGIRRGMAQRWSPNARYVLACAALAVMWAAPIATWIALRPAGTVPDAVYRVSSVPPAAAAATTITLPAPVRTAVPVERAAQFIPWVVMAWLAGAGLFWVRLMGGWFTATRMRSSMVRPAPPEWQKALGRLGARVGVERPVRLLVSGLVQVPTVVGWLRPVVLVPAGALAGLPADQLEAVLVHELAHIRRHDYLVNLLQSVAEALLFYHPAVWWVSAHIRCERELCCDDAAVEVTGDAFTYASALVEWEQCRPTRVNAMVAVNGGSLTARIGRLLGQPRPPVRSGPGVLAGAIVLLAATYGMFGQTAERPAFQAASIKPNTAANPRGRMVRPQPGGRLTSENAPLLMLIQNAYSLQAFQVAGGPEWINTTGYDIEAKPEGTVDRPPMWLMLQTLLADRFKLALHRETRELPLYALTTGKNGFKPPAPKEGVCISLPPDAPPGPALPPPGSLAQCGKVRINLSPAGLKMEGGKVQMAELVRMLAAAMGRPVLDRTGFTGEFDVNLSFTPDQSTMGLPGAGGPRDMGGPQLATDPDRPTIFAALQEQLGLKLVTAKGPVEVLVIDHVERPSEN